MGEELYFLHKRTAEANAASFLEKMRIVSIFMTVRTMVLTPPLFLEVIDLILSK